MATWPPRSIQRRLPKSSRHHSEKAKPVGHILKSASPPHCRAEWFSRSQKASSKSANASAKCPTPNSANMVVLPRIHLTRRRISAHGIRPFKFNWMRPGQNGVEGTLPVSVDAVLGCPTCRGDVRGNRAAWPVRAQLVKSSRRSASACSDTRSIKTCLTTLRLVSPNRDLIRWRQTFSRLRVKSLRSCFWSAKCWCKDTGLS